MNMPVNKKLFRLSAVLLVLLTGLSTSVSTQENESQCPPLVIESFNDVRTAIHPTPFPSVAHDYEQAVLTDIPRECSLRVPVVRTPVDGQVDTYYSNRESYKIQQRELDDVSQILTNFLKLSTAPFGSDESRYVAGGGYQPAEGGPTSFAEATACSVELLGCENFDSPCNLLTNGTMDVDTAGWVTNTTLEIVSDAVSGAGALSMSAGWASTTIDMKSEFRRFTLSGYAKSNDGTGWAGIGVDFLDSNAQEIEEIFYAIPRTTDYKPFSLVKLPPEGTRFARMWIYAAESRSILLDELNIHPVGCEDGVVAQTLAISSPGDQVHTVGDIITVFTDTTNPEGAELQWEATDLPPGLTIQNNTGWISGQATQQGSYYVTISVTDGINRSDIGFKWTIVPDGTVAEACNALPNGDFETGINNWFSDADLQITDDASEGLQALTFNTGSISVTIPAVAGTEYQLTGRYKSEPGAAWSGFGIDYLDESQTEIAEEVKTLPSTTGYTDTGISSTVPANAAFLQLWIYTPSTRNLTLDDLVLRDVSCDA